MNENCESLKIGFKHKGRHEGVPFEIEQWYPVLRDYTFKTYFIPLEIEDAIAMSNFYEEKYLSENKNSNKLTFDDINRIKNLEIKIQKIIDLNPNLKTKGCFVRLSGRSPKDGEPYNMQKIKNNYENNLIRYEKEYNLKKDSPQLKVLSFLRSNNLKSENAKEVLNILLSSERIHLDLKDWIQEGGKEMLVLREYGGDLCDDLEFRAFIYNNKLTAITQYDHYIKFEHIIKNKDKYQQMINDYWNKNIKHLIKTPHYSIDFAILNNDEVIVIEMSPFMKSTGPCCLKWEIDYEEMMNGNGNLKINENDYEYIDEFLIPEYIIGKEILEPYDVLINNKKETWGHMFKRIFSFDNFIKKEEEFYILVVSVLKTNFFWNFKYLSQSEFIDNVIVKGLEIKVDKNGMGWIELNKEKKAHGEIWKLTKNQLKDIAYFYGLVIQKKYEGKIETKKGILDNVIFFVRKYPPNDKNSSEKSIEEYTIEIQNKEYNNFGHFIEREEKYLKYKLCYPN